MKTGRMAAILRGGLVVAVALGIWAACLALQPPPLPLAGAVTGHELSMVDHLLTQDPSLIERTCQGRSLLHLAVLQGDAVMARLLLEHGADIEARDALGNTPLHAAAYGVGKTVLPLLRAGGAELSARNHQGQTPLHLAAYAVSNPFAAEIGGTLIAYKARRGLIDDAGRTPLDLARLMGNQPLIILLERP